MSKSSHVDESLIQKSLIILQRWRYLILGLIGLSLVIFEASEHYGYLTETEYNFSIEISIYLSLTITIGIVVEFLIRSNRSKKQAFDILKARHNLSMQLTTAKDWDEVVSQVLQYPSTILTVSATSLLRYDPVTEEYITVRSWIAEGEEESIPIREISAATCSDCSQNLQSPPFRLIESDLVIKSLQGTHECYCLRIDYGLLGVGMLHIYIPKSEKIKPEHILLFNNTAADIAIVLNSAWQRKELQIIEVENAATNERQEIQRDLHDTLGQNLGYIHLKLDQILSGRGGRTLQQIRPELGRLRDLANDSCVLVRNTLSILHNQNLHHLSAIFQAYARQVAERGELVINITEEGEPVVLAPNTVHQLFSAYKEALFNIEKHAHASQVDVLLKWEKNDLSMIIEDDGCGFDPQAGSMEGHYGLKIMGERISSVGGTLDISSHLSHGTLIKFKMPLNSALKERSFV